MSMTKPFAYTGRNAAGKISKGKIDAVSSGAVAARLRDMGLSPVSITEAPAGTGLNMEINIAGLGGGVKLKDLAVASRQMATMIAAGLSLLRTLTILAGQTENKKLASTLDAVRSDIETGGSLSGSMAKHGEIFPPIMIHLVRAGETGGFLERSLEQVADNFEAEVKLVNTVKSALTYPVVVLIMALLAMVGMLIFIVPVFENMFAGLGGELPFATKILVVLSQAMVWVGPIVLVTGIVFGVWWGKNKHTEEVRKVVDPMKLKLPVFGDLFKKVALARFTRNFSTMLGAGVPILQALAIVGETSGNYVIEEALKKVAESVRQGRSIAEPLSHESVFPPMIVQMVAVGEDAGSLEQMLAKIADFYDEEVESTTKQLTSLIEPLMIAVIGVIIGSMIVALYMPVFSVFDQIK
ncbi:type II secretion system F family protein [Microterricola viridarii]|uniref:Type IV pilus assembly protein PilC n=1 Tax=Microterricola viridarii TaxID=412690 RepID=A0A1H1PW61_9MICO|nr:type II secretion system F family protein [Microterricola viridarii]SDS15425.1 type IV pilus assembly protein PilC [Microterricola viridarii]